MFRSALAAALLFAASSGSAERDGQRSHHESPRLVVSIVVDQMRYDYLYRYWDDYGDDGFRRLLNEGFSFDNASFDYAPTYTGPGHASIHTGTTPSQHGIIGNAWYLRDEDRTTYVVEDSSAEPVGTESAAGRMSPKWLLASTLSDELRLHTNNRSRAVAFSLKDRGAILAAGRLGDAYWFEPRAGMIISSNHYMDALPDWVTEFNDRDLVGAYLEEPWETLLPIEAYTASIDDDNPYESRFSRTFPHDVPAMAAQQGRQVLQFTPRGNTYTFDFARAAIAGEKLGQDEFTDLLAISFSSTDYIGHGYAPTSVEVQDTYLRLDRELGEFLDHLDETIGLEDVLIVLTSDHGAGHNPIYLQDQGIPAGYLASSVIPSQEGRPTGVAAGLSAFYEAVYGSDLLLAFSNHQVFLDHEQLASMGLGRADVEQATVDYLIAHEELVVGALGASTLNGADLPEGIRKRIQRGFHQKRSGDVAVWFKPHWMPRFADPTGTTHFSPYSYDTRAPMVFFGYDIPAGRSTVEVAITDIAPTLAVFMNTPFPTSTSGRPLQDLIYPR